VLGEAYRGAPLFPATAADDVLVRQVHWLGAPSAAMLQASKRGHFFYSLVAGKGYVPTPAMQNELTKRTRRRGGAPSIAQLLNSDCKEFTGLVESLLRLDPRLREDVSGVLSHSFLQEKTSHEGIKMDKEASTVKDVIISAAGAPIRRPLSGSGIFGGGGTSMILTRRNVNALSTPGPERGLLIGAPAVGPNQPLKHDMIDDVAGAFVSSAPIRCRRRARSVTRKEPQTSRTRSLAERHCSANLSESTPSGCDHRRHAYGPPNPSGSPIPTQLYSATPVSGSLTSSVCSSTSTSTNSITRTLSPGSKKLCCVTPTPGLTTVHGRVPLVSMHLLSLASAQQQSSSTNTSPRDGKTSPRVLRADVSAAGTSGRKTTPQGREH
jgi:hypothetical protein